MNNLKKSEAEKLGCIILETPLEVLNEATQILPACSTQDRVCLIQARNRSWKCATNDKKLRKECKKTGIHVYWGLEIILMLVRNGYLLWEKAMKLVQIIEKENKQITKSLVEDFERKLMKIQGKSNEKL